MTEGTLGLEHDMTPDGPDTDPLAPLTAGGWAIAAWGVFSVVALLSRAIFRLWSIALEPLLLDPPLTLVASYVAWVGLMAYFEGYRGFQRTFSPRVVLRALHLGRHPRWPHVVVAPFFCTGLIHATRRRLITSWSILVGVSLIVVVVRWVPQPYRGIIDAGVIVGIGWGMAATLAYFVRAMLGLSVPGSADLPGE